MWRVSQRVASGSLDSRSSTAGGRPLLSCCESVINARCLEPGFEGRHQDLFGVRSEASPSISAVLKTPGCGQVVDISMRRDERDRGFENFSPAGWLRRGRIRCHAVHGRTADAAWSSAPVVDRCTRGGLRSQVSARPRAAREAVQPRSVRADRVPVGPSLWDGQAEGLFRKAAPDRRQYSRACRRRCSAQPACDPGSPRVSLAAKGWRSVALTDAAPSRCPLDARRHLARDAPAFL